GAGSNSRTRSAAITGKREANPATRMPKALLPCNCILHRSGVKFGGPRPFQNSKGRRPEAVGRLNQCHSGWLRNVNIDPGDWKARSSHAFRLFPPVEGQALDRELPDPMRSN